MQKEQQKVIGEDRWRGRENCSGEKEKGYEKERYKNGDGRERMYGYIHGAVNWTVF